ncbi:MAG: hypothetical protein GY725_14485 [bacterium]|nr:hypothetical protein [bacterium]
MSDNPPSGDRVSIWLLGLGAVLGLVVASASLIENRGDAIVLPEQDVAHVNSVPIRRADFERLVAGLESDTRRRADEQTRRRVLDRMIEEELLVQRGVGLGFLQADRKVRANLVSAVIAAVTGDAEDREPSKRELTEFYRENMDFFTQPGRIRVRQVFFRVPDPAAQDEVAARASQAAKRLRAGDDFSSVRTELGSAEVSILPDALLPATKLREYVGPTALRTALALADGEFSDPVRSGMGYHVLWRLASEPDYTPELSEIEVPVQSEWRRRTGDRALREYLDELRTDAEVAVAPELR